MKTKARKQLAQQVRLLRTNRGWSQEVLAELSGLNRSHIGTVERAEHNIGFDNIERIAAALETGIPQLLDGCGQVEHAFPTSRSQHIQAPGGQVIVHRRIFLELLRQCEQSHRELVVVYLERCGVTVSDWRFRNSPLQQVSCRQRTGTSKLVTSLAQAPVITNHDYHFLNRGRIDRREIQPHAQPNTIDTRPTNFYKTALRTG